MDAANTSATWYETFAEKMQLLPMEFAYDYLMRSGRLTRDRLRQLAPKFVADFEAYEAKAQDTKTRQSHKASALNSH